MTQEIIKKLSYSNVGQKNECFLPLPLQDSLQLICAFFSSSVSNKICLVFPSKEYAAQWLSIPIVLNHIKKDYSEFKGEIFESYRRYQRGDRLILNNQAIVEWVGVKNDGVTFKTKGTSLSYGAEITIRFSDVNMLQKAPSTKKVLSSLKTVKEALPSKSVTVIEKLLNIDSCGNKEFIKSKVCIVTKYKSFDDSINNVTLNFVAIPEYFPIGKIDDNGRAEIESPLLLANNLSNLALYSIANAVSKIIIDGFSAIQERGTDFSDIDVKNIPTILITDLSEIESFEKIGNYGFEFFNFTKENLKIDHSTSLSPFHSFENKLEKYISFNVIKEVFEDVELEAASQKIHSIEKDDSNSDLTTLKISLIQLVNNISRVVHILTAGDILILNSKINSIESLFLRCRIWIGNSYKSIEESISILRAVIKRFAEQPSEKCKRMKILMDSNQYDYIICSTEEEVKALVNSFSPKNHTPRVISVADVNDKLVSKKPQKAILTGWTKSSNINRILSSFLFSEITVLFYRFENKYYNSLQRRNKQYSENAGSTINSSGIITKTDSSKRKCFGDLYKEDEMGETPSEISFDILDFEFKIDNAQYSRYAAKGNLIDSIRAKRIVFENDLFIFTTESHKFLLVNKLIERKGEKVKLNRRKVETLQTGDVIAFINTDRDILVELVEKNTNKKELEAVKQWTELWKTLLKDYYKSIRCDFRKLVEDLRNNHCTKHEVTIKTWLQDESRIGPDDDADLISIALLTKSDLLSDNIKRVRESITIMKGWRHNASDYIIDRIKAQIHNYADNTLINRKISVEGLGSINVLKVFEVTNTWEDIDVKYVNRLLQKDII